MSVPGSRLRAGRPNAEHRSSSYSNLLSSSQSGYRSSEARRESKKLLSMPRRKIDQKQLVHRLGDVRGEIARPESELHAKS
jgi:hypothetical protein